MSKVKWTRNRTIAAMYRDGATLDELATQFGISKPRVHFILKNRTAIVARPRGRPRKTTEGA